MSEPKFGDDEIIDGRYPMVRTRYTEDRAPITSRGIVFRRDNYRCVFCGSSSRLEVDHIIPWSAGGSDDLDNLRTLCHWCNTDRSNFRVADDEFRRLPNGGECVNCQPQLIGEDDITGIYCIVCDAKAPGLPFHAQAIAQPQSSSDLDELVPDELWAARRRKEFVDRIRAAAPPAPMPDDDEEVRDAR